MRDPAPPRHLNIARKRWAELLAMATGALFLACAALMMLPWALDGFGGEADKVAVLPAFVLALAFPLAFCFGAGVFGTMALGRVLRWGATVDLDADEIVIPRAAWRRIPFTLIYLVGCACFALLLVGDIANGNVVGILFWLLFLLSMVQSLRMLWRHAAKTYAPVVLDSEGIVDRSTDQPRIPWHDIADIDKHWGRMTLTGETEQRIAAAVPDRRLLKRWRKRPGLKQSINAEGLEPDQIYAFALIRAYWLRRMAEMERS